MTGTGKRWAYGIVVFVAVLAGTVAVTPAGAAAPVGLSGLQAAVDCGSHPVNHRKYAGVHINLWLCHGYPGAHGPMYHAQIANAEHNDVAILRYRTTMNNQWLSTATPMSGQNWANTQAAYGLPDELQACANILLLGGGYEFVCAWTANDGGS
jgi:hypothetical protein